MRLFNEYRDLLWRWVLISYRFGKYGEFIIVKVSDLEIDYI